MQMYSEANKGMIGSRAKLVMISSKPTLEKTRSEEGQVTTPVEGGKAQIACEAIKGKISSGANMMMITCTVALGKTHTGAVVAKISSTGEKATTH